MSQSTEERCSSGWKCVCLTDNLMTSPGRILTQLPSRGLPLIVARPPHVSIACRSDRSGHRSSIHGAGPPQRSVRNRQGLEERSAIFVWPALSQWIDITGLGIWGGEELTDFHIPRRRSKAFPSRKCGSGRDSVLICKILLSCHFALFKQLSSYRVLSAILPTNRLQLTQSAQRVNSELSAERLYTTPHPLEVAPTSRIHG